MEGDGESDNRELCDSCDDVDALPVAETHREMVGDGDTVIEIVVVVVTDGHVVAVPLAVLLATFVGLEAAVADFVIVADGVIVVVVDREYVGVAERLRVTLTVLETETVPLSVVCIVALLGIVAETAGEREFVPDRVFDVVTVAESVDLADTETLGVCDRLAATEADEETLPETQPLEDGLDDGDTVIVGDRLSDAHAEFDRVVFADDDADCETEFDCVTLFVATTVRDSVPTMDGVDDVVGQGDAEPLPDGDRERDGDGDKDVVTVSVPLAQ